ncbi:hypothetical protein IAT40_000326 [Kwoniella sp. CBS 6097]
MSESQVLKNSMAGISDFIVDTLSNVTRRIHELETANARLVARTEQLEKDVAVAQAACQEHELFRLKFAKLVTDVLDLQQGQSKIEQLQDDVQGLQKSVDDTDVRRRTVTNASIYMLYKIIRADYTRLSRSVHAIVKDNELREGNTDPEDQLLRYLEAFQPALDHNIDHGSQYDSRAANNLVRSILGAGWPITDNDPVIQIYEPFLRLLFGIHSRLDTWALSPSRSTESDEEVWENEIRHCRPIIGLLHDILRNMIQTLKLKRQTMDWNAAIVQELQSLFDNLRALHDAVKKLEDTQRSTVSGNSAAGLTDEIPAGPKPLTGNAVGAAPAADATRQQPPQEAASQLALEAHLAKKDKNGMKPWPKECPPLWEGGDPKGLGKDRE